MKKKLKIAIYSGTIPSTTFIENLIKGISIKNEVLLFGKLKSKPDYISKNIHCFPTFSNKFKNLVVTKSRTFLLIIKYPKRFQLLWQLVKPINGVYAKYNWWSRYVPVLLHLPDVFHVQWAKDIEKWFFLKQQFNCKIVLSLRGAHINYSPIANPALASMYRTYFPKIDAFHAVSDAIGLEAQKYGADPKKITKINSLIPKEVFDFYKPLEEKKNKELKLISVGRHHWKKGYSIALDSCKRLKEKSIPFRYTIIASGKVPEELLFQRHQLGLEDEVQFLEGMPQIEVFKEMQQNDVLLLPSLEEGIANVVLEAMALGVPVISTNCGGMSEVIKNNKTGWLVPVFNEEAISVALNEVVKTSFNKRQEIVKNAYNFVKKEFNEKDKIIQFNKLYELI